VQVVLFVPFLQVFLMTDPNLLQKDVSPISKLVYFAVQFFRGVPED
jgi:hypothetical protein